MKIYLAGRYGRREQLKQVREVLQKRGHVVTSRWLDTDWETPDGRATTSAPPEYREKYCLIDLEDVMAADVVINFTEASDSTAGKRGGRHVEFGVAIAAGKRLIVIGHRENIFHWHPSVEFFATFEEMLSL